MSKKSPKRYDAEFKARVALEAAQEQESLAQIGQRYRVHPVLVGQWKKQLLKRAPDVFRGEAPSIDGERVRDELLKKIGELTVERDFLARGSHRSR